MVGLGKIGVDVERDELNEFCRSHHIQRLLVYGSAVREDFGPDSDVDILVEFEDGHVPGLIGLADLEIQLSRIFDNRKVDLTTPGFFRPVLRKRVLDDAVAQYGEG